MRDLLLKTLFLLAFFIAPIEARDLIAHPTPAAVNPMMESGGNANLFKNAHFSKSLAPHPLPLISDPTKPQKEITAKAQRLLNENEGALSLLLIDKERILFEGYKAPASAFTAQHSMSMSKSLTAYLIGAAYCDGKIRNLEDRADTYSTELKGTVYGDATIKQLLTMSSGAAPASYSGSYYQGQFDDVRSGKVSALEIMRRFGSHDTTPGKEFRYLGNDTQALGSIMEAVGGFSYAFEKYIWSHVGAEADGFWLLDKDDMALAYAGASAITRDWGRLAIWSLAQLKSPNDCFRQFMKAATSAQIANRSKRVGASFSDYGYQTWIRGSAYWWVGFGGQRVGIDPRTERILILTSWREDYMAKVYALFDEWVEAYAPR